MVTLRAIFLTFFISLSYLPNFSNSVIKTPFSYENDDSLPNIHGLDISHYQKNIKWSQLPDHYSFVVIKATEGSLLQDPKFKQNWDSAKKNGIIRGAYHFYRPNVTPYSQFRNFVSMVKLKPGDLPPVVDAEIHSKYTLKLQNDLKTFILLLERHYKIKPIIYCNRMFYKRHFSHTYFDQYHFWIADYKSESLDSNFQMWDFWQYTCYGKVSGIPSYVDMNYFRWGYDSLRNMCLK